jgi:hypothetical protein
MAVECTAIDDPSRKPTPQEVKSEVWMSIISGAKGILYFVHQFKPVFDSRALLDDPAMLASVTALNHQITALAPILNSPSIPDAITLQNEHPDIPVSCLVKRGKEGLYLFTVGMRNGSTTIRLAIQDRSTYSKAEVVGENRTLTINHGSFEDHFSPWEVHLYLLENH